MVRVTARKVGATLAAGVLACSLAGVATMATTASALPYTHSEEQADAGGGLIHVLVTIDETEVGGFIKTVWLPVKSGNPTVEAVMDECLNASEDKTDRFAHADYELQSLGEYLEGKEYTVSVYAAGAQKPGADLSYTSESIGDETYAALEKGDGVYFTITSAE